MNEGINYVSLVQRINSLPELNSQARPREEALIQRQYERDDETAREIRELYDNEINRPGPGESKIPGQDKTFYENGYHGLF